MKRYGLLIGFGAFLLLVGVGFLCSIAQAQDKVITLNYAHFMPTTTKQAQLAEQWCREVEKRTNGRVKITF